MAKRKNMDVKPNAIDDEYEEKLIERKKSLQKQMEKFHDKAAERIVDTGLLGALTGAAIVTDFILLGGIGTFLTAGSAAFLARNEINEIRVRKELSDVENQLTKYKEMKEILKAAEPAPKTPSNSIASDFTKEASPEAEAEALKKRLSELEAKMQDIQNPKQKLPFDRP